MLARVAHERAAKLWVAHRDRGSVRTHLHLVAELRGDGPDALLMRDDLLRDVGHAQLVDPRLAHGRVTLVALALPEFTGGRAMAVGKLLDPAATHPVQIVVTARDALIRAGLRRPQASRERPPAIRRQ